MTNSKPPTKPPDQNEAKVVTQNLAIMFTDMKGYTAQTAFRSREEIDTLLELHSNTIKPLFEKYEGRIIKTIGDAFLVVFQSPTNAVLCGKDVIKQVSKLKNRLKSAKDYAVRVVINSGEVHLRDNDVFGEAVNIASRIEDIAEAGEVWITEALYLSMNKNEVSVNKLGEYELKGVPYPITIYSLSDEKIATSPQFENPTIAKSTRRLKRIPFAAGFMLSLTVVSGLIMISIITLIVLSFTAPKVYTAIAKSLGASFFNINSR